jgi:phosphomannomutase
MAISKVTLERAQEWCRWDPNERTANCLQDLLNRTDEHAHAQLTTLFPPDGSRIGFGTAGLRAAMDIGPLRMNDLVIVQTAQGIARYCQQQHSDKEKLRVVIGYDHRSNPELALSSLSFAILSTLVFETAGIDCVLLDGLVATPLIPFATTRLGAAVGIMVTASHNPKEDDGYKVYWSDGCQIRPPVDKGIADSILENLTPWTDYRLLLASRKGKDSLGLSNPAMTHDLRSQYFDAIQQSGLVSGQVGLCPFTDIRPPTFCYTAMHGVGRSFAQEGFIRFGLPPFLSVPQQEEPDPEFPTVSFPNPEEKGALDMAKAHAEEHGCDVVLANDPDADRLAVAERSRETGEWAVFTGDQIGALLGSWLWEIVGKKSDEVKRGDGGGRRCLANPNCNSFSHARFCLFVFSQ